MTAELKASSLKFDCSGTPCELPLRLDRGDSSGDDDDERCSAALPASTGICRGGGLFALSSSSPARFPLLVPDGGVCRCQRPVTVHTARSIQLLCGPSGVTPSEVAAARGQD